MIQPRLSRSLQLLTRQQRQWHRVSRTPFVSSPFSTTAIAPSISQRISGRRWYSQAQEAESKKEEVPEEAAKPAADEAAKDAAKEEDPVQQELAAKKQEVIDLTVRCLSHH
jgi:hypothetical protein